MSQDWFADVVAFMREMRQEVGDKPARISPVIQHLRVDMLCEEHLELLDAIRAGDLPAIAKEAIDQIYVNLGTLAAFGIDPHPVWDAVHRDNMAKAGGPVRADGKRLKPEGWQATDIGALLAEQKSLAITPEMIADEWISRNNPKPYKFQTISGYCWPFWRLKLPLPAIPELLFPRLNRKSGDQGYPSIADALSDLRQALVSLIRDGIELPEITTSEES